MFQIIKGIPKDKSGLGLITYALCSDGVYLIRSAGTGHIITKADGIAGLPVGQEDISTLPRKIPISLFWETIRFFKYVEAHYEGAKLEAYVLIMYEPKLNEFFLHVPEQTVGAAQAKYDLKDVWEQFPGCKVLMDIHSHTSQMDAFFSTTDDADDNRDRFSGVIGRINHVIPDFKVRFSTLGRHIDVEMNDLFCDCEEFSDIDCEDAITRVHYTKPRPITGGHSYSHGWAGSRSAYGGLWNAVRDRIVKDR